jgi:cysteine-rich repeat protein
MEAYEKSGATMRLKALHSIAALLVAAPLIGFGCTGDMTSDHSALSGEGSGAGQGGDCTLTQGYWKNHVDAWPVASLKLGSVSYTKVELLAILKAPVKGNGLIQLAHQLIAAKLNIAAGADDAAVSAAIDQADALIGSLVCPPTGEGKLATHATSSLEGKLAAFNEGDLGPGHCGDNDHGDDDDEGEGSGAGSGIGSDCGSAAVCGDGVKDDGEECDDGNVVAHDGCSATCTVEAPVCGNGYVEDGESCDDGNLVNGDGCSSACACECPNH